MPLALQRVRERARKIKMILLDVDGVLTDGKIYQLPGPDGSIFETKGFHSRDGLGIRYAREAGLMTGIITGRSSGATRNRAKELKIDYLEEHRLDKINPYEKILKQAKLVDEQVCYVGDDLVDLPILKRAGLAVGVRDADPLLRRHVHYMTLAAGGAGAVREVIEIILDSQGKWETVIENYLKATPKPAAVLKPVQRP